MTVPTFSMLAPSATANYTQEVQSGNTYTADAYGVVKNVPLSDYSDLTRAGWLNLGQSGAKSNFAATAAPTVSNDNTQDYGAGSRWLNVTTGLAYECVSAATGAAVWTALAVSPAGVPWVTGQFYGIPRGVTPVSLRTITATLYAYPIIIPNAVTLKSLNLNVLTGQTGGAAHVGLYADNGNGYPGALVQDSGVLAATSTAMSTKGSLSVALSAGLYWGASIFTASSTMPSVSGSTVAYGNELANMLGFDTAAHALAVSSEAGGGITVAGTYGSLPPTFTAGAALNLNAGVPLIGIGV